MSRSARSALLLGWALLAASAGAAGEEAGALPTEAELVEYLARAEDPAARDLLGVLLSRQGRLEEAEGHFRRALETDPDFPDARRHLARLYLLQGREPAAAAELRAAARLGPLERDLAMKLATVELAAGDRAAAERQLASLAERFDSVRARLELARLAAGEGAFEEALGLLRPALDAAPNSEDVLAAYARVAVSAERPVAAIVALEPLERMHPAEPEYPYLAGVARLQAGDVAGAVAALERAAERAPGRAVTLAALGLALNQQKRFAEAKTALEESLRLAPDGVEALAALAEAEEGLAEYARAEEHARRALDRDPAHPIANLVLGVLRMRAERFEEAAAALARAVAADPDSPKAHYQLALAYSRLGDEAGFEKHLALYREALAGNEERLLALEAQTGGPGAGGER